RTERLGGRPCQIPPRVGPIPAASTDKTAIETAIPFRSARIQVHLEPIARALGIAPGRKAALFLTIFPSGSPPVPCQLGGLELFGGHVADPAIEHEDGASLLGDGPDVGQDFA